MKQVQTIQASWNQIVAMISFLLLLFGGLFLLSVSWWVKGAQSASWQPVAGRVEKVHFFRSSGTVSGTIVDISFSYSIEGRDLACSRLAYGPARKKDFLSLQSLAVGDPITVWVNGNNLDEAVLFPGVMFGTRIITGTLFIALSCIGYALVKAYGMRGSDPTCPRT